MLTLNNVHTYYGNIHALKGVSCSIPSGNIACLIGANGAGKSTTLMTIFGVQPASKGEIHFKGKPIHTLRPEQVADDGRARPRLFLGQQGLPRLGALLPLQPRDACPALERRRIRFRFHTEVRTQPVSCPRGPRIARHRYRPSGRTARVDR